MNDAEIRVRLHDHVWSVLTDLAVDETLTQTEADDVREAMSDLAEMLIDSLQIKYLKTEPKGEGISLTVNFTIG